VRLVAHIANSEQGNGLFNEVHQEDTQDATVSQVFSEISELSTISHSSADSASGDGGDDQGLIMQAQPLRVRQPG
jgi:hypothetical protein